MVLWLPTNTCKHFHVSVHQALLGLQELALKLKANGKVYKPKKRVQAKAVSGNGAPAGATGPAKPQRGVQNARPGSRPQDSGFAGKEETGTRPDRPPQVRLGDSKPWLMHPRQHLHGATWAIKQSLDPKQVDLQQTCQQSVEQHVAASSWITSLPFTSQSRQAVISVAAARLLLHLSQAEALQHVGQKAFFTHTASYRKQDLIVLVMEALTCFKPS